MRTYRRLLAYARPHLGLFIIGVVGMVISAATNSALTWFINFFIQKGFVEPDPRVQWLVPLGVVVLIVCRGLGDYLGTYFPGMVGRRVIKAMRADLFAQYLHLPSAWYDRHSGAPMLSRLTYDIEQVAEATTNSVTVIIRDTLTLLGLLGTMFYLSWQLTLLLLVVAPVISVMMKSVNKRFRRYSARIQASMGDVTHAAKEAIEAQRLIKVFNAQPEQLRRFERVNDENCRSNVRLINARAASNPVVQVVASLGLALVLAVALNHGMQAGGFVSFIAAMLLMMAPLKALVAVAGPLQQGIAAGAGIFAVIDAAREPVGGTHPLARAQGTLAFEDVSFAYGSEKGPVLRNITLDIPAGHTVAFVGRSGSGKSTLASLVPRFYDPVAGCLRLDGVDVRDYPLQDLRRQISYVGQEVLLFDDSIRNNILCGLQGVDESRLQAAADAAHVTEFATQLPLGLDTLVGERGTLLSGGQRQRIAIARALLRDAPVLILDEATSALDNESERHIQAALAELVRGRTTLVIAHRLSTVEQADRIVVLDAGRIVETGTHQQLLAQGGLYAQLHRLQFDA